MFGPDFVDFSIFDKINCQWHYLTMLDVEVIENPGAAAAALSPLRGRLLAGLKSPASAAELAAREGLSRQRVNYHLRALESHGLVSVAEERTWGGLRGAA